MNAIIIFTILLCLMLTGMPISISLLPVVSRLDYPLSQLFLFLFSCNCLLGSLALSQTVRGRRKRVEVREEMGQGGRG